MSVCIRWDADKWWPERLEGGVVFCPFLKHMGRDVGFAYRVEDVENNIPVRFSSLRLRYLQQTSTMTHRGNTFPKNIVVPLCLSRTWMDKTWTRYGSILNSFHCSAVITRLTDNIVDVLFKCILPCSLEYFRTTTPEMCNDILGDLSQKPTGVAKYYF